MPWLAMAEPRGVWVVVDHAGHVVAAYHCPSEAARMARRLCPSGWRLEVRL